jgi:hypothetical protein
MEYFPTHLRNRLVLDQILLLNPLGNIGHLIIPFICFSNSLRKLHLHFIHDLVQLRKLKFLRVSLLFNHQEDLLFMFFDASYFLLKRINIYIDPFTEIALLLLHRSNITFHCLRDVADRF